MAAALTLGSGLPVALGQIDLELKKLWEQSGGVATRASLINLALYCEGRQAMAENTELIAQVTEEHACRAILICLEPEAREKKVQAWIGAHCHLSRAGAKQVCSEQITFLLEGSSRSLIPNIVFSHLDSDLPLYFWWQGSFPDPIDCGLWAWVDRLIFDSAEWRDKPRQFALLNESLAQAKCRLVLCDLNWVRSLYFRQALALTFDHPDNLPLLANLERIVLGHAPGHRCTALLVAGWLAAQLGLCGTKNGDAGVPKSAFSSPGSVFRIPDSAVEIHLLEQPGASLNDVSLLGADSAVHAYREGASAFLHVDVVLPDKRRSSNLYPAGKENPASLLGEELVRGGRHQVYLRAMQALGEFY